jgi:hypothetical protein
MSNDMVCNDSFFSPPSSPLGYLCTSEVPITDVENNYYIRCADQPWFNTTDERNLMQESFPILIRKPVSKIKIESTVVAEPGKEQTTTDLKFPTRFGTVEVKAITSGGGDFPYCRYYFDDFGSLKGDILSEGEELHTHKKTLSLEADMYELYIECSDETGDSDRNIIRFRVIHDTSTPKVARVWQEFDELNVVTNEFADCRYSTDSCRFKWDNGTSMGELRTHTIKVVKGKTYYVKCSDEYGNIPSGCSVRVTAT